ncbi:MAG TPA: S46 family peptidase [Bryobacteraceae bacterium]|nr:S46 family peptidase [Bryobacteraceae bacterium]
MRFRGAWLLCLLALPAAADEGMWLFNQFPQNRVKEKYSFDVSSEFLENLRLASVQVGSGSGAFVSPNGLLIASQTGVGECLPADGFYAAGAQQERACPGLEARVLFTLQDVTASVKAAAPESMKPAEALQKQNATIAKLEQTCSTKTGHSCRVVKFFSGQRYLLYEYKVYSDVRLVFAPEHAVAFFGGPAQNLTYTRYGLDAAFLRAYENGKPAATPHYLKWSSAGAADGELVFTVANPSATSRLSTAAQLTFYRDTALPFEVGRLQDLISAVAQFAAKGPEDRLAAQPLFASLAARYKSAAGRLIALRDELLLLRKQTFEKKLRNAVERDPKLGTTAAKVWDDVASAYKAWAPNERAYQLLESDAAAGSDLFQIARTTVRLAAERAKPNDQRLAEYRSGVIQSAEAKLKAPAALNDSLEALLLAKYLEHLKALNDKDVPLKQILGGHSPEQAAEAVVHSTKLRDVAERQRLASDPKAIAGSSDGMIRLARLIDGPARKVRKKHEDSIESLEVSSASRIEQYRLQLYGANEYPEGNGTPRVMYGVLKAYKDRAETAVPYTTTLGGLFYLAIKEPPFKLPQSWADAKSSLDLMMPFNFVSTCDTTGGNSGPTVNKKGEFVGLAFDGNLESLSNTYLYSEEQARTIHVAAPGIVEALRKIYKANRLLEELGISR